MPAHHVTGSGPGWRQYNVAFDCHETGERVMSSRILPALVTAHAELWWFIRKQPAWRLRYLAASGTVLDPLLDQLARDGEITSWTDRKSVV